MKAKQILTHCSMFLCLFLAACSLTGNRPLSPSEEQVTTSVAATLQALQPTTETPSQDISLPAALYYLSAASDGSMQVWRLAEIGAAPQQLTTQPGGISEFDVSQPDGRLAFITASNQLYIMNADGSGLTLLVDSSDADPNSDEYFYQDRISGLSWAPEGWQLAYGHGGLHMYVLESQVDALMQANQVSYVDDGMTIPKEIYSPGEFSPDGSRLLVEIGYYEGSGLGVYVVQSGQMIPMQDIMVCCHAAWSLDSQAVYVASPYLGMISSGMWRYDPANGAQTELIPTTAADGTLNFAGWPLVLPDGSLMYFYANTAEFPQGETPLLMVHSTGDGSSGRQILRPEEWLNYEALWAPDGSLVVAVQPIPGVDAGWPRVGTIVLIPASGDAVIPLAASGYALTWGP